MTPDDLKRWRKDAGLNQRDAAAQIFGVALTTYQSWEAGKNLTTGAPITISRAVDLACGAIAAGVKPYSEQIQKPG